MNFRRRIQAVLIVLVVVVEAATFGVVLHATRNHVLAQGADQLEAGSRVLADAMQNRNRELATAARVISTDAGFISVAASGIGTNIETTLANHRSRFDSDLVLYVNRTHEVVSATDATTNSVDDESVRTLGSEIFAVVEPETAHNVIATIAGTARQLAIAPVFAPQHVGWVVIGFNLDNEFAARMASLTNLDVSLTTSTSRSADVYATTLDSDNRSALEFDLRTANFAENIERFTLPSGDYLGYSRDTTTSRGTPLRILLTLPLSNVLAGYQALRSQLIAILIVALVISFILSNMLAKRISQPLQRLSKAALRIRGGDYSTKIDVSGNREFDQLASAFNAMLKGIAKRERHIVHQSQHDSLTGLPNRFNIAEKLEHAVSRSIRNHRPFSALMLDIDGFRSINDTLGRSTGDETLKTVGRRLRSIARDCDTVARLGGDEFMVLLDETDLAGAESATNRINELFRNNVTVGDMHIDVHMCIGIVGYPHHGENTEQLMRRGDIALNMAKDADDRSVAIYQSGRDEENLRRLSLVDDLQKALANDGLDVHYQPKVAVNTNRICGVEALARWSHPQHGFISPEEFIPLAEKSGHIRNLTVNVLHKVLQQLVDWRNDDLGLTASINLSALDLRDVKLPDTIRSLLAHFGLPAEALVLEVTESAIVEDAATATEVMQGLRDIGIKLAIDDFGTGQASLAYLKNLPVDELKIDKSFILNLPESKDDAIIVRSTIELAHNMGLTVTGEGVENKEAIDMLQSFGCDCIQGFFISKPVNGEIFSKWLHDRLSDRGTYLIRTGDYSDELKELMDNDAKIAPA